MLKNIEISKPRVDKLVHYLQFVLDSEVIQWVLAPEFQYSEIL